MKNRLHERGGHAVTALGKALLVLAAAALAGCDGRVDTPAAAPESSGGSTDTPPDALPPDEPPPGGCENSIDYDDGWAPLHAVFHYDATGNLVRYKETLKDGTVRFLMTRTYDAKGRRVTQEEEGGVVTPVPRKVAWEYDDQDRVVHVVAEGFGTDGGVVET